MSNNTKQRKCLAILLIVALLITTVQPLIAEVAYAGKNDKLAWDEYKVSKDGKTVTINPDDYEGDTMQDRQDNAGDAFLQALQDIRHHNGDAKSANTIVLQGNIIVNETQNSENPTVANISVTVKGEGKPTIAVKNYKNYFLRGYKSKVTLENLVIDGQGNARIKQGGCLYGEDTQFTLKNVTIQNFNKKGYYDDSLSAPDGYGEMGDGIYGGAAVMLFTDSFSGDSDNETPWSSFKMDGNSKIVNCYSYEAGGNSSVTYDFGAIGGAVYLQGLAQNYPMTVELNGEIDGGNGSAVYAKWCDISMGNKAYIHNGKGKNGGAMQLSACGLTMNGSKIENCEATTYGGALYLDAGEQRNTIDSGHPSVIESRVIHLNQVTIQNCTAKQGGAVYADKYKMKAGSLHDKDNVVYDEYGYKPVGHVYDYPYITFDGSNFYNNSAEIGGAIYNNKSYLEIKGGTFSGNAASKDGGAVYKTKRGSVILSGGVFENNTAAEKGPDIYADIISNVHGYSSVDNNDERNYAQDKREYLYVKGSPKVSTPIYIANGESNYEHDPSPVQVLGPIKETIKFDFQGMGKDAGSAHDPLIAGYGTGFESDLDNRTQNIQYHTNKYTLTHDDFMNLIVAQHDSHAVSYNGGRSKGEYGAYFPGFFDANDKTEGGVFTYNTISAVNKADETKTSGCDSAASEIIYISSNGDDSTGDGSKGNPVKTYNKARELMKNKISLTKKDEDGNVVEITDVYYINSIASLTPLTSEMGVPNNIKDMVWYPVDHPGSSIFEVPGTLARAGKELKFTVEWPDGYGESDKTVDNVTWMILKGEMPRTNSESKTDYVAVMPEEPVMILADTGQVEYIRSVDTKLDVPDPDNVEETSYVTIQSVTVSNFRDENESNITDSETIASIFGGVTVPVDWKKVEAGTQGFTEDEPFAVFNLYTGYIENGGEGIAIGEDIVVKVNGKTTDIIVNGFDDVTVSHHVDKKKIPELPAPTVTLDGETVMDVDNAGTTHEITAKVHGVYDYTKPVNWEIVKVSDPDNIITLPEASKGTLPAGKNVDMSFGDIIVAANPIGDGAKSATIKIKFSKEKGILNYQGMPDEITLTYNLAKGENLPQINAAIDFEKETIEVTRGVVLQDYAVEYLIVKEGDYREGLWNVAGNKLSLKGDSLDIKDYIFTKDHGVRYAVYMRFAARAEDPGPGEVREIVIPERPDNPIVTINYKAETTTEVIEDAIIYGTANDALTETGNGEVVTLTPGTDVFFQYKATDTSFASGISQLVVKNRQAAPEGIGINYTAETTNKVIPDTVAYETSVEKACLEETVGFGNVVSLTPGVNLYFVTKSTESEFRSDVVTLEVPNRPEPPVYTIDYTEEKTVESIPLNVLYGISADAMDTVGIGERLKLSPGTDVYFYTPATMNAFKSNPYCLDVKERRGEPDVKSVNEDIWGEGDGKIKGLDADAEYRKLKENGQWGDWKSNGSSKNIKDLTTGTYQVRYIPTSEDFVSEIRTIDVGYDRTITVTFNSKNGTSIEDQTGLKYDSKVAKPADPHKKNCEFVEWCEDLLLLFPWDFDKDTVKDDLTLYAKWKRNKMDTPEDLKWNKNTAKWDSVDDEDEYVVRLYKEGSHVETVTVKKNSYDMSDLLKKHGSGDYDFTVVAVSEGIKDSDVAGSPTRTYYRAPDVTKEPADYETTDSAKAEFEVGAKVDRNENLSYQWQRKEDGKNKWENIDGATETTYIIKEATLVDGVYTYRCRIQDQKDNEIFSRAASLVVNQKPEVTISVSEDPVERMADVTLTAHVTHGTGKMTYKWTDEDKSTTEKITLKLKNTSKLKVTVTDERGVSTSQTVKVNVKKSQAELVLEEMLGIEDLLKNASKEDATSGHIYYLMKTAIEGYEDLSDEDKDDLNAYDENNRLEELYAEYKAAIDKSDEFSEKVRAIKSPFSPSTRAEIQILAEEMDTLLTEGVPVSTSISDEETGRMAELTGMLENTRSVQQSIAGLVKDVLTQMNDDDMEEFKSTMKSYIDGLPEAQSTPGLGEYLKQLVSGENDMTLGAYMKSIMSGKSSEELEQFREVLVEKLSNSENKEETITYLCDTLAGQYGTQFDASIKDTVWAYYDLREDERNMVAPVLKRSLDTLYNKMLETKPEDQVQAIVFEEKLKEAEGAPTMEGINNLEAQYEKLTDAQKGYISQDVLDRYQKLVEDKNAAADIASRIQALDTAKVRALLDENDGQGAKEIVEAYQGLSDERRTLIKDALGRKADNVIDTIEVIKKVKALDRNKMSDEEYWDSVEEIVKDVNLLSGKSQEILKEVYLNNDSKAAAEFKEWRDSHKFVCEATTPTTKLEVVGATEENLSDVIENNSYTEIELQAYDISTLKVSGSGAGKETIVSVDTQLLITRKNNDGSYNVNDASLKNPVQVKMKLPNNYQTESMELWQVTDDNKVNRIRNHEFVWEDNELYVVFETKEFGQFIVYAKDITTTVDILIDDTSVKSDIHSIELDTYYDEPKKVTISAKDLGLGIKSVEYHDTPSVLDYESVKKIDFWHNYSKPFTIIANKNHVIYVKVTDTLGNITYFASTGIIVDNTAPSITGITDRNYCTSPTMTVTDTNLKTTTIDGKAISLSNGQYSIPEGTHEIVAKDLCGNSKKVTVTVFDGHKPSEWQEIDADTHRKYCEGCGAQVNKEEHKYKQEVVASKHLKKAATYNDEGTYYNSCVCGRTDDRLIKGTFKGGGLKYDGVPPTVKISVKNETNKKIKYHVEMSDGESGIYRRYHYDAGAPMDVNGVLQITGWERLTAGINNFTIKKDKTKAVYAKAVDEQGNYTIIDQNNNIVYQYVHPKN